MTVLAPDYQKSKNRLKIPLRLILVVPFILQISVAIGLTGWLSLRNGQKAIDDLATQLQRAISDRIQLHIDSHLKIPHLVNKANENPIQQGLFPGRNLGGIEKFFLKELRSFDSVHYIDWSNKSGDYIGVIQLQDGTLNTQIVDKSTHRQAHTYEVNPQGKRIKILQTTPNYDPRIRPGYKAAKQVKRAIWSPIYIWFDNSTIAFDAVLPVYDQKSALLGVLDTPVMLSGISEFLRNLHQSRSGQSFIIERSGLLVATSTSEVPVIASKDKKPQRLKASESRNPITRSTAKYLTQHFGNLTQINSRKQVNCDIDGARQFLQVTPVRDSWGLDWLIVVVIPESDFMAQITANTRTTTLLCLGALVLATVLGILISQWIAKAISRLRDASQAIASGEFEPNITLDSIEELSVLGAAFNLMGQQLKQSHAQLEDYARSLEQKVKQRTQALQQEIRDRTLAQEALRASEERWQLALTGSSDGIWDWNFQTNEVFYSNRWKEMLGHEDHEIGNQLDEFLSRLHPNDLERTKQSVQDHISRITPNYIEEFRLKCKDGSYKWILARAQAVWDEAGKPVRLVGSHVDISDRQQREKALQSIVEGTASAIGIEFFHCLVQHLAQVLQVRYALVAEYVDEEKTRVRTLAFWLGEGFGENFEYNLAGTPCTKVVNQQQWHYPKNLQPLFPEDLYVLVDLNIQAYWAVPLQNSAGDAIGVLAVLDVNPTLYSQTQESILKIFAARAGAELERKYIEQQLRSAKEVADSANQAKSEFLANMSHELRTPLNGVLGYAQLLSKDSSLNQQQQQSISTIHQCGSHLLTLINDILDLSKIEARKMELYISSLHFPSFLQGIAEICRIRAEQKGISLTYYAKSLLPEGILADEKRLRQVLINLLSNAIKFTDVGRVIFTVEVLKSTKDINDQNAITHTVRFQIEDTGVGMNSEEIEKIFLPFEQVGFIKKQAEGTGLGLTISKNIIEIMGSTINVKSQEGVGSIFWVDLEFPEPVDWVKATQGSEQQIIVGIKEKPPKILVVDDKWENRSVLSSLLQPIGFELVEATNGQEGLEKAAAFRVDAIITDLVMPVMNGFEMMRYIRASPELKDVVIIASSASTFDVHLQSSLSAGSDDFLPKPVQVDELFKLLQKYLKLTWIYEFKGNPVEQPNKNLLINSLSNINLPEKIVPPPAEELEILWNLASKGRVTVLQEQAERIEKLDRKFVPFAKQLSQLSREFKIKQIREFIKLYLKEIN